jgi:nitrate/TMAO reductase-like tetraheme cytochrome c subunit
VTLPTVLTTALASIAAAENDLALPRPRGWIGTTDDWARGLGIAFVLLAITLLALAWGRLRRAGLTPGLKELLILPLVVLPPAIVFFGYSHGIERSKSIGSCGSCHVMKPYLADLQNPASETLAATHYKNRYIQENHCYTCHTDYGMFGTVQAKMAGLGHVTRNLTGAYSLPLKIAHPYANGRCLACHGDSQKFLKSEAHPKEDLPKLVSGETSCLDCHGPAHPTVTKQALR